MNDNRTPGPWKLAETWDQLIIEGPNGEEIIEQVGNYGTPAFKHSADARLVAAAPELLEVCIDILDCYSHFSPDRPALARARAIIAKATNETLDNAT